MKIFFDQRILYVLKPETVYDGEVIHPRSAKEIENVIVKFEKDPAIQELGIMGKEYKKLKKKVKECFVPLEAAGGVVKNERGEILFIFRRGKWDLPKGKINSEFRTGEKRNSGKPNTKFRFRMAEALREVKEETGLQEVVVVRKLKSTYHAYYEKKQRILKKTRWFEMAAPSGQTLVPQAEEDILYVRWFKPEELGIVLENTYPSLKKMITEYCSLI